MSDKRSNEKLDDLRERLYAREAGPKKRDRFKLTDEPVEVSTTWVKPPEPKPIDIQKPTPPEVMESVTEEASTPNPEPPLESFMPRKNKRNAFRFKLILAGIFFFVLAVGASSLFIMFGGKAISGDNIAVNINGPFTIGGGEVMRLQMGVTNQNAIPIESATLIIEYPAGTQAADSDQALFTERLSLDVIDSGQTVNVPVQAKVFGEENEELVIHAAVEYRVRGSNATFFKEAEPLEFKISSAPVVLDIKAVKRIAAGQETDVVVAVRSNSTTELTDILVQAEYPNGFDFTSASPEPVSGQNIWSIGSLAPEESKEIVVKGAVFGSETETYNLNFSVGVPNERDKYSLASVFSSASTQFEIEEPFINIGIAINGLRDDVVAIESGESSNVSVRLTNTLQSTVYDGVIEMKLSGNALSDAAVEVANGYYDSNTKLIRWDVSSAPELGQLTPGAEKSFSFNITPASDVGRTPQIFLEAILKARRLADTNAQEEIIGTVASTIKVSSETLLTGVTAYNIEGSNDTGPIPPKVGETTSYTLLMSIENGSNDVSDVKMTALLPSYVTWLGNNSGTGNYDYNPTSHTITWNAGDMDAGSTAVSSFQVSILPSTSQIGKTPTLVSNIRLSASDDFTGAVIKQTTPALITTLPESAGYQDDNGNVVE